MDIQELLLARAMSDAEKRPDPAVAMGSGAAGCLPRPVAAGCAVAGWGAATEAVDATVGTDGADCGCSERVSASVPLATT